MYLFRSGRSYKAERSSAWSIRNTSWSLECTIVLPPADGVSMKCPGQWVLYIDNDLESRHYVTQERFCAMASAQPVTALVIMSEFARDMRATESCAALHSTPKVASRP